MSHVAETQPLRALAALYLSMVQRDQRNVSHAELEAVIDTLLQRFPTVDRAEVQNVVLDVYATASDLEGLAYRAVETLQDQLSERQKSALLKDLARIAQADGIILDRERGLLVALAQHWHIDLPKSMALLGSTPGDESAWGVLHDLAFIYLSLAHGTDYDLSEDERLIILRKLREWKPSLDENQIRTILNLAMDRYAHGPDQEVLNASIESVKASLPLPQRMAALHDLTQIANADGIFLDNEEDLINDLMNAWNVDPYAAYGSHGAKE